MSEHDVLQFRSKAEREQEGEGPKPFVPFETPDEHAAVMQGVEDLEAAITGALEGNSTEDSDQALDRTVGLSRKEMNAEFREIGKRHKGEGIRGYFAASRERTKWLQEERARMTAYAKSQAGWYNPRGRKAAVGRWLTNREGASFEYAQHQQRQLGRNVEVRAA